MAVDWDVLGIGCAAVDDLLTLEHFPEPDSKMPVIAQDRQGGGLTATALVAAARLGASAAFRSHLGEGELAGFTLASLSREGIDCSPVLRTPGAQPYHSVVLVDRSTGLRTILYSGEGVRNLEPEDISAALVARASVLLVDDTSGPAALAATRLAQSMGKPVVADVENLGRPAARDLVAEVSHLVVGIAMARQVTGERDLAAMAQALAVTGRACAAVTDGARGCWYAGASTGGQARHIPALKIDVVDTTGCGDVFHGAFAAALAHGDGVERALRIASVAAGLKATLPGGRAGIPNLAAVEARIHELTE